MNDRVSNKPPSLYIKDEQIMERYRNHEDAGHLKRLTHHPNSSISQTSAGVDNTKSSGIFRFGKAVANAFNPVNIWQGLNGRRKENQENIGHPEAALLNERQAKAHKAYAELKQSDFEGTKGVLRTRDSAALPSDKLEQDIEGPRQSLHRDSGIDVDSYRSSDEHKDGGRVFAANDYLAPPRPIAGFGRSASPASDFTPGKNSSLHLRSSSLQSLKKAMSHVHLPVVKRQGDSLAPPLALIQNASLQDVTEEKELKKQPSRKDLEKQQKLGKKVSDLEAKLDMARHELQLAKSNDATPYQSQHRRKPFVPGALPSLPSEGLLDSRARDRKAPQRDDNEHATEATRKIDAAVKASKARTAQINTKADASPSERETTFAARAAAKAQQHKPIDTKKPTTKKRKSSGGVDDDVRYKPDIEDDDDAEWEAAKAEPKKKPGRPRKSQKVENDEDVVRMVKVASRKTETEHTSDHEATTVVKAKSQQITEKAFDPAAVDKDKLLKMRSKDQKDIPFGQLEDDIINLQKIYPGITDEQVIKYIASLFLESQRAPAQQEQSRTPTALKAPLDPLIEEKENATAGTTDDKTQQHQQIAAPPKRLLRKTYSDKTLTQHTSVAHANQPPPSFLGRPRSASPVKRDKLSPRFFSPPPSLHYSNPTLSRTVVDDTVVSVQPTVDQADVPPMPKVPGGLEGFVRPVIGGGIVGVSQDNEKDKEKEPYEWPEDVF